MYVYEEEGHIAGLVRVEREIVRDEWTIVELDAVGHGQCRRHPLPAGPAPAARRLQAGSGPLPRRLRRCRRQRRAADAGRVHALRRGTDPVPRRTTGRCRSRGPRSEPQRPRIRRDDPARRAPAVPALRPGTPQPVARLEAFRLADWERQGAHWRVPRSSLTPILRFADVEAFVQAAPDGGRDGTALDGLHPGRRRQGGPAALPQGHRPARGGRRPSSSTSGSGIIARARQAATIATITASSLPCEPTNRRSTGDWRTPASTRSRASPC